MSLHKVRLPFSIPAAAFAVSLFLLAFSTADAAPRRPNILFVFTDDHAPHAIGAYGGLLENLVYDLKLSPDASFDPKAGKALDRSGFRNLEKMTEEQRKKWDAAYEPKNKVLRDSRLEGKDLVRWKYQRYMKDYLRCIRGVDESVGRLMGHLEESGLAENTIVIYSSDQGFYLGDHGWFDKRWMYEESLLMPLIVKWPGVTRPGSECRKLAQNLDYAETFLEVAGAAIPDDMQGRSLVPLLKGEQPKDWRRAIYYHYHEFPAVHMVARHYGIRTERYKLIRFYQFDEWEFYDLEKDPDELMNRYGDRDYAGVISRLKGELERLRRLYKDDTDVKVMPHEWQAKYRSAEQSRRSTRPTSKRPFVHPGILHNRDELEFVKSRVERGEEPWKSAWEKLRTSLIARLDWKPRPRADVVRGAYNNPNRGGDDFLRDGSAAYTHALEWCLRGERAHAEKAIEILKAYASTLKSVGGHDARLLVGMGGIHFLNAAELARHTYDGWAVSEQQQFSRLLREVFFPVIKDFYPTANGNWDAAMIQTMLALGVFLDDRVIFDRGVDYYLKGAGNGAITRYINDFGECQESGRDQAHTQMGLGYLGCAAEIAWKQGVDLYGASNNRLLAGFEYTAKYNLGHEVPYKPYRSFEGRYEYQSISPKGRGRFNPIYERVYHHYHDRKGLKMPFARKVVEKNRPERWQMHHVPWSTLMCARP